MAPHPINLDTEKLFVIPLTALRLSRSHPDIPRNKIWFLQLFLLEFPNFLTSCVMIYSGLLDLKLKNYPVASQSFLMGLIYYFDNYQFLMLATKGKTLRKIIEIMKADYAKDMPQDERDTFVKYAKKGKEMCFHWFLVGISFQTMLTIKFVILEGYTWYTEGWKLLPLYPLTYPSPIEEYKQNLVVYALIQLNLIFYLFCTGVIIAALSPLGVVFMLHACGHLEIVIKKVSVLYVNKSTEEVEAELKDIIQHLHYIYTFVDYIKDAYRLFYEMTMKATSIAVSIAAYEVLVSLKSGELSIVFITYSGIAIVYSSYPCYFSDMLMEQGEKLRLALYNCGWERRYDHGVRKTLLVMLLRALEPTVIRTIFRTVCLDALTDVFQEAYAIFNLINAFY